MFESFGIKKEVISLSSEVDELIKNEIEKVNEIASYNSLKVLSAFQNNRVSDVHFNSTTGYGYGDIGSDTIESIYAEIFKSEDALVRSQFISGSHALTVALFAVLRPGDIMLSITGKPYDTLEEVTKNELLEKLEINIKKGDIMSDLYERLVNENREMISKGKKEGKIEGKI